MPYLIDGHNLIPKIRGMSLRAIDDENKLITLLQVYYQQSRKKMEVYFDNAPAGQNRTQRYGAITAHFVSQRSSADDAIRKRLDKLGGAANTWTVVSSDRQVQAAARASHARVLRVEDFAKEMLESIENRDNQSEPIENHILSPEEVNEWLRIFGKGKL